MVVQHWRPAAFSYHRNVKDYSEQYKKRRAKIEIKTSKDNVFVMMAHDILYCDVAVGDTVLSLGTLAVIGVVGVCIQLSSELLSVAKRGGIVIIINQWHGTGKLYLDFVLVSSLDFN